MDYTQLLNEVLAGNLTERQAYVKQLQLLEGKLDPRLIASRSQGGQSLSYLQTHDAIQLLNNIFGTTGWNLQVVELKEVAREEREKNGKSQYLVGYTAHVRLQVQFIDGTHVMKEDVGAGNGQDYQSFYSTSESATKEAVSDALKRAARHLGNQLGGALYDKEQRRVGYDANTILLYPVTTTELRGEAGKNTGRVDHVKKYLADNGVEGGLAGLNENQIEELFRQLVALP